MLKIDIKANLLSLKLIIKHWLMYKPIRIANKTAVLVQYDKQEAYLEVSSVLCHVFGQRRSLAALRQHDHSVCWRVPEGWKGLYVEEDNLIINIRYLPV